ncbi:MAG: TldD/PmbA family protein [Gemmatimonadaceae bacterium]|nr:TldD/PmbA family protein [Gemmatimonadaceae bacterium]
MPAIRLQGTWMRTTRRDFLATTGTLAAGAAALAALPEPAEAALRHVAAPRGPQPFVQPPMDAAIKELLQAALNGAQLAGASFADARIARTRRNFIITREQQIIEIVDTDTMGCGVRALVDGCWGFAATRTLTRDGVAQAAREAAATAKANRLARDRAVQLAPAPSLGERTWSNGFTIDPWSIPVEEKAALMLKANAEALKVPGVKYVFGQMFFVKEEKNYANTEGTLTAQTLVRSWAPMSITAVSKDFSDFQNRSADMAPQGRGWEAVLDAKLVENARKWGEDAAQKLTAKPVEPGKYDLVLHPSHLWLTIHESIGHPTELDRAYGYEANYAGTSFVAPPEKMLGELKYGPEFMNVQGDRSQAGGLSTVGYDDEGVAPDEFLIIKDGKLNDYQTTREQADWLTWWYEKTGRTPRSHGNSYADAWSSVQFQRMPNVSLLPGAKDLVWEDLIGATDQFGGQTFHEIKGGKIVGMLKDVAYQIRTPEFWNAMDMIGGKRSYQLGGSYFDGKGQPGQVNAVSHGSPPTRHRQITVINTGRKG